MRNTLFKTQAIWTLSGTVREGEPPRTVTINSLPFRVGRRSHAALVLASPAISSTHAELIDRDGELWVCDLKSTNGTFVNGQRLEPGDSHPVKDGDFVQFANIVFRLNAVMPSATLGGTVCGEYQDSALGVLQFDKLMRDRAVVPYFQPIVDLTKGETIGFEILGRSRLFGLQNPKEMFGAAAQLNLEAELSRMLRVTGVQACMGFERPVHLFLNTHPAEIANPEQLIASMHHIREVDPDCMITLELHESAVTNSNVIRLLRDALRELSIGLAYDDFGAGQARLVELVDVPPDYLKFDMSLVQNIAAAPLERQNMLATLVRMVRDMGIAALAEGVEREADNSVCQQIGFELGQGYYYGRPAPLNSYLEGQQNSLPPGANGVT